MVTCLTLVDPADPPPLPLPVPPALVGACCNSSRSHLYTPPLLTEWRLMTDRRVVLQRCCRRRAVVGRRARWFGPGGTGPWQTGTIAQPHGKGRAVKWDTMICRSGDLGTISFPLSNSAPALHLLGEATNVVSYIAFSPVFSVKRPTATPPDVGKPPGSDFVNQNRKAKDRDSSG